MITLQSKKLYFNLMLKNYKAQSFITLIPAKHTSKVADIFIVLP